VPKVLPSRRGEKSPPGSGGENILVGEAASRDFYG